MGTKKIMKKESGLDYHSLRVNYYKGEEVEGRFYDQHVGYGSLRRNYIPEELEKKKWRPEGNKTYKCWWYHINPADPCDSGESILVYLEEVTDDNVDKLKKKYISDINTTIEKFDINKLKRLKELIERGF